MYDFDGTSKVIHKVIFPFTNISTLKYSLRNGNQDIGEENIPSNDPYLINKVTDLFDSYEEARRTAWDMLP